MTDSGKKKNADVPSVGLGGCLTGFIVAGGVLLLGNLLLEGLGLHGAVRTVSEIGVMALALGAALFLWKVAATADEMTREEAAKAEGPRPNEAGSGAERD